MTQTAKTSARTILTCAVVSIAAVSAADWFAPLGVAIYMLYLVPVALTFYCWRMWIPLAAAGISTVLLAVDFLLTPMGPDFEIARLNRGFGAITIWLVAVIGYRFIRERLAVREENWLQAGQTNLGEQLLGEQRMEELGDSILRFSAETLGAAAGALFVSEGGHFKRCATFGAAADSVPETFSKDDGLLGQAAKDGRDFLVSDVPDGYLAIGSGLGKSSPRHLLISPMRLGGKANAVMELGFLQPVREVDRELVRRVETAIAVAVRAVKYRVRLQELLEETQQQSEEVQAQSEELRVSNEELEEQSRALQESQGRLELQQTELEQINTQLEAQTETLERQKRELVISKKDLERQAREVEKASRYKSDFLANMSHELRTPLNSSLILSKLLAENRAGNLTPEQVKYALTIESSGNDLLVLINDVLDLSKIEAGHMEIHPETIAVSRLAKDLQDLFEPIAGNKSLALDIEITPDAPKNIVTDMQRLEQVLKNLLSNALKFTESGAVKVRIGRFADGRVSFAVTDTGIGIAPEQQRTIFAPFFQADGTTSRKYGGTGLGLSISRDLTRLLGGEIRLASTVGEGSTFTVIVPEIFEGPGEIPEPLPIPSAAPPPPDMATAEKFYPGTVPDDREHLTPGSRLIMTVEDDISFAGIISDLAHEMNFQCIVATSVEEALALAFKYLPSAIVLDVGLPDHSGLLVLERLKADRRTRHIPIHVVSAGDHTRTALELGAIGYLLKPVKRDRLAQAFRDLESRMTDKMRRVLVVEDDPVQMEAMRDLLGSRAVETVCVRTAAECLENLSRTTFDCMVLDLSLPDASGFSLLEKLSQEDAYSFPPVIVYTGRDLTGAEEQRLRKYSKSIIIKGAKSPERLLDEVSLFLHQVVAELPPEKQRMLETAANRDAALEGRKILVAEDDVRNVFALTSLLEGRGVTLRIARNGREAIAALEAGLTDPAAAVDLVLMDIMMPEMDGFSAMREIRKRREWAKLPIIALTAKAMKNDQEQCLAAGASDYLAKPLDVEKLLSLIRVWMPR